MVDFKSPTVISEDAFAVIKLWHVVDGIFIWEFFITLDYEWSIIRGYRPYRWTIWIYSFTRFCTLLAVVLNMVGFDSTNQLNCQLWVIFELIFAYLAFAAASLLIVLRVIAIWDRNRIAVAIAACAWSTNVAFLIHGITQIHAAWVPTQSVCTVLNIENSKDNIIVTLITDVILLLIMLVGLLRLRQGGTMLSLGKFLWRQGLIWLFLATIAEVTPTVFISLNLNDPLNLMFQTPSLIVMSIASTRLYRGLTDFTSTSGAIETYQTGSGRTGSTDPKRISTGPIIPMDRVEVTVRRSSDDYPPANAGQYRSFGNYSTDTTPSQDKPLALSISSDLEGGVKNG